MGDLTRGQLITQAGLAAGDDTQGDFVRTWLDAWMKRTAKSWTWPMLRKKITNVPMAAGDASVAVGNGTNSTFHIHRLLDGQITWRSASGFSPRGRMFIRSIAEKDPDTDSDTSDPLTRMGAPELAYIRTGAGNPTVDGIITILPNPTPDRAILLAFDAHIIPAAMTAGSAGDTLAPWYPNDRTLLQAVKCAILESGTSAEKSQLYDDEMAKLAAMVIDDRDFDGTQAGDNEVFQLDPQVFR